MNLKKIAEKQYSQAEDAPRPIDKRLINFLRDIDSGMNAQEACKKYGFKIENKTCLNCGNHPGGFCCGADGKDGCKNLSDWISIEEFEGLTKYDEFDN